MSQYEIYTFLLCLTVFAALTALLTVLVTFAVRLTVRLIRCGAEDQNILRESARTKRTPKNKLPAAVFSTLICCVLCLGFALSLYLRVTEKTFSAGVPSIQVVKSGSTSFRHRKNTYLVENGLHDQIQTFDLILTRPLPDEFSLRLCDTVVYEVNGELVIHRIVKIEEPNEKHPGVRSFVLQGDAVEYPDHSHVLYSQMHAIYRGERIPFVGSLIMFLQSPAGSLCILLTLFAWIAAPVVERKIARERKRRLDALLRKSTERSLPSAEKSVCPEIPRCIQPPVRNRESGGTLGLLLYCGVCVCFGLAISKFAQKRK